MAAFKLGVKPGPDHHRGVRRARNPLAEAKHVGGVMLSAHSGRENRFHVSSTNPGNFIGGDAHADAGAADENSSLAGAVDHGVAGLGGIVRVIHALGALRAEVDEFDFRKVPDDDSLIIETQIAVEDISEVRPTMHADVHLTAYKQRITPVVPGEVLQISADRIVDNKSGLPYYSLLIRVDQSAVDAIPNASLYPGMPATVMIPTARRTAFEYVVGPLAMSFNRAFRQR